MLICREKGAIDPDTGEVFGFPLHEAVWRTNHGYDPAVMKMYQWYGNGAYKNSKDRYNVIHDHIDEYEKNAHLIGAEEAVRITSAVGQKGDDTNEEVCDPSLYSKGTYADHLSVLSCHFNFGVILRS